MNTLTPTKLNLLQRRLTSRGGTTALAIGAVALTAVIGLAVLVARSGSDSLPESSSASAFHGDSFTVQRGSFDVILPSSGELAALRQVEIRNRLETKAVITEIVEEGKQIKAGDVVIRLADDDIELKIRDAEDAVKTAEAALIAAQANLAIRMSARDSDIDKADLAVELARIALKVWQEGEVLSKRRTLALGIETAQKDSDRLDARYKESVKLFDQKFISLDELKRDEIAMIQAAAKLEQARLDNDVYEKYQFEQDQKKKESDVEQAVAERQRVEQRHTAELETARSDVESKKHQHESTNDRLDNLKLQLSYCTITAPIDGLVVYASSLKVNGWGGNEGQPPVVGTELRPNDFVIALPDTSQIVANIKVNESLTGLIEPGQRVIVTSDAMPNVTLEGEVVSIGVLAETGGWRDPNRRDYTVRALIKGENERGLKPSMRCKADIYVGRVQDAVHVPVQAVFRDGASAFVYIPQGGGYAQKAVAIGRASELYIEVAEGLKEGETVLLREPAPSEIVARLAEGDGKSTPRAAGAHEPDAAQPEKTAGSPGERRERARRPTSGTS